jgi:hypothetical protein
VVNGIMPVKRRSGARLQTATVYPLAPEVNSIRALQYSPQLMIDQSVH